MAIIEPMDNYSYRPIKGKNLARGRALNFAEAEYGAPRPSRVEGRTSVAPNYADIDAASFGALASGNAPSISTSSTSTTTSSPYQVIQNRSFGDPRTMMNSAIQNAMMKMRLGVQRSDLTADTAMTLGDIGRYAARDREGLIDRLNARNVFNSGIKEKALGRSVGDELRYKGRTMNQAQRGLRDLSLAGDEADFSEFQTNVNSMLSDADQIRANMASRIKEFSV